MIVHKGKILQLGFGAVGKSFFEKVTKEISFDENKYFVITKDKDEFEAYVALGGVIQNFILSEIKKENWQEMFSQYLDEGDLLIDFTDNVGTRDFCEWCAENNIMYINTGETDWEDNKYDVYEEYEKKIMLQKYYKNTEDKNKYPILLYHGNNPGLVSHFVKAGIDYISKKQFKKDKEIKRLLKESKYNEIAKRLRVKMIHINDIDSQVMKANFGENVMPNSWNINSFWYEMLSNAAFSVGVHEKNDYHEKENGYVKLNQCAIKKRWRTYYPNGVFNGYMVPHEEMLTIAKLLEIKEENKTIYRPSVMFLYSPCDSAMGFLDKLKNDSIETENAFEKYAYPMDWRIIYPEDTKSGTEYVGVLLLGENFNPVWVGNRIKQDFLFKDKKHSDWQTPTITPVAMSALAGVCWMLKNKDKGGIYFPEDIEDYSYILKIAEKYISKTIYKTFTKEEVQDELKVDLSDPRTKNLIIE